MDILWVGVGAFILFGYFAFEVYQLKSTITRMSSTTLKDTVSKKDPVYREISLVLKDAIKEGEGIFLVRKMDESEYFYRMDPDEIYRRSKKS